jgi:hypothetical protein
MHTLVSCALALVPTLCVVACVGTGPSATTTLEAKVADAKSVTILIENGRIEFIKDAKASGIEITAEVRCYGRDQAEADTRLTSAAIVAQPDSTGAVRISVNLPKRTLDNWGSINSDVTHVTVRAADLTSVGATTMNGSITVGAFSGSAKLETSNGTIKVNGHSGSVHAETSNGSINITGAATAIAETSNGSITVALGDGATGDLRLETSNGSVTVDLPAAWEGTVTSETSVGAINLSGGAVKGKGDSKSMTIGDATKATATIETSVGSVTVRPASAKK